MDLFSPPHNNIPSSSTLTDFDVLIIGAGVTGLSTGYHLAREGHAVALFDRSEAGIEASSRNGGGLRQQGRCAAELPLAVASVLFWTELAEKHHFEYVKGGNLRVALDDQDLVQMEEDVARQGRMGLEVHLIDRDEAIRLCSWLDPDRIRGGAYCPSDGHANPILATRVLKHLAAEAGVRIMENEPVLSIEAVRNGILIRTGKAAYCSPKAVLAAGAWSADLLSPLGLKPPLRVEASCIAVTEKVAPMFSQFIYREKYGYTRQAVSGNFHLGSHLFEETSNSERSLPLRIFRQFIRLGELIPALRDLRVIRAWSGMTTWTPDKTPILDFAPGYPGLFAATGMSGHGFCLAPAVGRLASEMISGRSPSFDPAPFRWDRFDAGA